jgi:hypothetical protein
VSVCSRDVGRFFIGFCRSQWWEWISSLQRLIEHLMHLHQFANALVTMQTAVGKKGSTARSWKFAGQHTGFDALLHFVRAHNLTTVRTVTHTRTAVHNGTEVI